jgi:hypothetical protein
VPLTVFWMWPCQISFAHSFLHHSFKLLFLCKFLTGWNLNCTLSYINLHVQYIIGPVILLRQGHGQAECNSFHSMGSLKNYPNFSEHPVSEMVHAQCSAILWCFTFYKAVWLIKVTSRA